VRATGGLGRVLEHLPHTDGLLGLAHPRAALRPARRHQPGSQCRDPVDRRIPLPVRTHRGRPAMRAGNDMRRWPTTPPKDQIHVTRVGLQFPDNVIAFEEWQQAGSRIARAANSAAWYLGDWLAYGEFQYTDRYRTVIDTVGVSYQTLRNYA